MSRRYLEMLPGNSNIKSAGFSLYDEREKVTG